MKKQFVFICILLCTISYAQQFDSINSITKSRPQDFEYLSSPDSLGIRKILTTSPLSHHKKQLNNTIKLPYPIIFIHGLCSNSETWAATTYSFMNQQYGLSNGGRFDYCLNYDGNNNTSNTKFYPNQNADIAVFAGTWGIGDYYFVNFDVGINGSFNPSSSSPNYVLSNQSAIVKQGKALRDAIYRVLQLTGRNKVILMGHSMGGLAAREYIQNPNNWMPDGKHHVAKLVTTGTPHGGSNASMSFLGTLFTDIDNQSEAVRDLRTSYFYSDSAGVFLFGGLESNTTCDDILAYNFYNVDINCNEYSGNQILGLNQKSIQNDIDYSCIIGKANPFDNGDYAVDDENADLNNFYNLPAPQNTFTINANHISLTDKNYENMQGLDEPNQYNLSYNIGFDTTYTGFITKQPIGGYYYDFDDYQFNINNYNTVTVSINNINLTNLIARIVSTNTNTIIYTSQSNGASSITFTQNLSPGNYYLEIYGVPNPTSYLYPYQFKLNKSIINNIDTTITNNDYYFKTYPNPINNELTVESSKVDNNIIIEIYDALGKLSNSFKLTSNQTVINLSELKNGFYILKIKQNETLLNCKKIVKQ